MIYKEWMKYIRDDVKLTNVVIPGAHNAGSYGMAKIACCQGDDVYTQFRYGVRHFCVRIDTKGGELVMCHGPKTGKPFREVLDSFRRIIEETPSEFIIIDLREYQPQKIGPFKLNYRADARRVDELIEQYLSPEKYAFYGFDDVTGITMETLRKSGKKFLLVNYAGAYRYSMSCPTLAPWDKLVHGLKETDFVRETMKFFNEERVDGLYWFQTQQTPNFGTDIGVTTPRKLDKKLRGVYERLIESIAENPTYLQRANIISGDFMTEDFMKCRSILMLNILKNNVISGLEGKYFRGLWRNTWN